MLLITLVRTLIALETARITAPHCPVVGNAFATTWLATVQNRGTSRGLARVVQGAALRASGKSG
jgi:hypothetical protein